MIEERVAAGKLSYALKGIEDFHDLCEPNFGAARN
jgi:hypothetical protein